MDIAFGRLFMLSDVLQVSAESNPRLLLVFIVTV